MKRREGIVLACRLLSLYVAYEVLVSAAGITIVTIWPRDEQDRWSMLLSLGIPLLLLELFGLVLWLKAGRVATHLVFAARVYATDARAGPRDLQAIAFSAAGMFVVTNALLQVPVVFLSLMHSRRDPFFDFAAQMLGHPSSAARLGSVVAQFVLGAGLFFGSPMLVRLLRTVRETGFEGATSTPQ